MRIFGRVTRRGVAAGCVLLIAACGGEADRGSIEDPVPLPDPSPIEYPVALWDMKVQGQTEVLIHVNEFGDVDSAFVSLTSGYAEFDSAAVAGARKLRFTPGRRDGKHVPVWTRIPVRFAQDSSATLGPATATGLQHD
jgi:periplasmic protein TonB